MMEEFKKGFSAWNHTSGKAMTFIVMVIIYFVGIGLCKLFVKITRKPLFHEDFLKSSWIAINVSPNLEDCKKMY